MTQLRPVFSPSSPSFVDITISGNANLGTIQTGAFAGATTSTITISANPALQTLQVRCMEGLTATHSVVIEDNPALATIVEGQE